MIYGTVANNTSKVSFQNEASPETANHVHKIHNAVVLSPSQEHALKATFKKLTKCIFIYKVCAGFLL